QPRRRRRRSRWPAGRPGRARRAGRLTAPPHRGRGLPARARRRPGHRGPPLRRGRPQGPQPRRTQPPDPPGRQPQRPPPPADVGRPGTVEQPGTCTLTKDSSVVRRRWAYSSAEERPPYKREATGSNPVTPTDISKTYLHPGAGPSGYRIGEGG